MTGGYAALNSYVLNRAAYPAFVVLVVVVEPPFFVLLLLNLRSGPRRPRRREAGGRQGPRHQHHAGQVHLGVLQQVGIDSIPIVFCQLLQRFI